MKATFQISDVRNNIGLATALLGLLLSQFGFAANLPPVITTQPAGQTVLAQSPATFQVAVSSLSPLTYQWRKNGVNIAGATSSSLTIASVQPADQADYSVRVTNAGGVVTSANAVLIVLTAPPVMTNSTSSAVRSKGTSLTFSHDVKNGVNRALFVGVSMEGSSGASTSVTYGGAAMTLVGRNTDKNTVEIWKLVNPPIGTANIIATFNSSRMVVVGAAAFNNVNQTTPTDTFVSVRGKSTAPSVTVASAPGELVPVTLFGDNGPNAIPGAGQGAQWNSVSVDDDDRIRGAGSIKAGSASTTMSYALSSSVEWTLGAVAIKSAPLVSVMPTEDLENTTLNPDGSDESITFTNPATSLVVSGGGMGLSPAGFSFGLSVTVGRTYVVEASSNTTSWTPIATNMALNANEVFTDTSAANFSSRFYRVMMR